MSQAPHLIIHTDGASRGNPGPAAFAYVIERDGQVLHEEAGRLPDTTNNQAEYTALVRALEHALRLGPEHRVTLHSDSELMVKQMNGQYRVKDAGLRPLYEEAVRPSSAPARGSTPEAGGGRVGARQSGGPGAGGGLAAALGHAPERGPDRRRIGR
jgi:ribonuclease HI